MYKSFRSFILSLGLGVEIHFQLLCQPWPVGALSDGVTGRTEKRVTSRCGVDSQRGNSQNVEIDTFKNLLTVPDLASKSSQMVNWILQISHGQEATSLFTIYMHDMSCVQQGKVQKQDHHHKLDVIIKQNTDLQSHCFDLVMIRR